VVLPDHPLVQLEQVTLDDLARYPIISYTHSFDEDSDQASAFTAAAIEPNVVFTAEDPDVIKNYVRKGMGVGIVACMAYDSELDDGLVAIDASHLFPSCTTWIGFRRDRLLRDYMTAFLELMVPSEGRERFDRNPGMKDVQVRPDTLGHSPVSPNQHPAMENRFSNCCNGGFNL